MLVTIWITYYLRNCSFMKEYLMPKIPYFNFPMLSFIVHTALKPPPEIIKHLHATLCCPFHSSSYISFLTVSTLLHIDSIILYIYIYIPFNPLILFGFDFVVFFTVFNMTKHVLAVCGFSYSVEEIKMSSRKG